MTIFNRISLLLAALAENLWQDL